MDWLNVLACLTLCCGLVVGGIAEPELPFQRAKVPYTTKQVACSYTISTADCSWANQSTIPAQTGNSSLTTLFLNNNKILNINSTAFARWSTNLLNIDLSSNNITVMDPYAFKRLKNLQYLDLSNNSISSPNRDMFSYLLGLKGISLRSNQITTLTLKAAAPRLKYLLLDQNSLMIHSVIASYFPDLGTLTLNSNRISTISTLPISLLYLDIRENVFTNVTGKFANLRHLNVLRMGQSTLLPNSTDMLGLTNLTTLELANINAVYPKEYFTSTNLTKVYMRSNSAKMEITLPSKTEEVEIHNFPTATRVAVLPTTLTRLVITECPKLQFKLAHLNQSNLSYLHLANIYIPDRGQSLTGLTWTKLTTLILENCNFTSFAASNFFKGENVLATLNLRNNTIANIQASDLQFLGKLYNLTVSYNRLTTFSMSSFRLNANLQHIDASYNLIEVVNTADLPSNRPQTLNLAGNRIIKIDPLFLRTLAALQTFDLSYNRLTEFSTFTTVTSNFGLKVISNGNPWACTCNNIVQYGNLSNSVSFHCGKDSAVSVTPCLLCNTPANAQGMYIDRTSCSVIPTVTQIVHFVGNVTNPRPTNGLPDKHLYIIIGLSAFVVLLLIGIAVAYFVVKKRRHNAKPTERAVDLGPPLKAPTHMQKPETRPTAPKSSDELYQDVDAEIPQNNVKDTGPNRATGTDFNPPVVEPTHIRRQTADNTRQRGPGELYQDVKTEAPRPKAEDSALYLQPDEKQKPTPSSRPVSFLDKMKEEAVKENNDNSLYEDGYMVMPAGQSIPQPVAEHAPAVYRQQYVNLPPAPPSGVMALSKENFADRNSFGNLGSLITMLFAKDESQAQHEYMNDDGETADQENRVYMEAE